MKITPDVDDVVLVSSSDRVQDTEHGFVRGWGVSGTTVGSKSISMAYGVLAPGVKASPHFHIFETAIYIVAGYVRVFYGKNLDKQLDMQPGDFLYIPAYVVHSPENISDIPMEYVVARNAPDEIAFPASELEKIKAQVT